MKKISLVTPCYNEEGNIQNLYEKTKFEMQKYQGIYDYEHIFVDNASLDESANIIKAICAIDSKVKLIENARNFGHIRSPYYGLLQATGDAVMLLVCDLQDPPELIHEFIKKWEQGYKIVVGCKNQTEEGFPFSFIRRTYYKILASVSEIDMIQNFTGFGLYDKKIIEILSRLDDPYPFFRGLICELGFEKAVINYTQPLRKRGITKNNFYTLYDIGILGLTSHSKKLLRLITLFGLGMSLVSLLVSLFYFIYKIIYWNSFTIGIAPLVLGFFFFSSIQLIFLGILSEYVGNIYTKVMNRPLVVEKSRTNF